MLFPEEREILFLLARDRFSGSGVIVDAGSLVGASAYALASGLAHNPRTIQKPSLIHSYDSFIVDEEYLYQFISGFRPEIRIGDSFFETFVQNLREHLEKIVVHNGNFLKESWAGEPVEILFADICKNVELNSHLIRQFYPALVPGLSIIVHQDFHHPYCPWIHVHLEYLWDSFATINERAGESLVLDLVKPFDRARLAKCIDYSFSPDEEIALIENLMARLKPENRGYVGLAKVLMLLRLRGRGVAERALADTISRYSEYGTSNWHNYAEDVSARVSRSRS